MESNTPTPTTAINRGFDLDFTPIGCPSAAQFEAAQKQLLAATAYLEATVAAVLESCPQALDAQFANTVAAIGLKGYRLSRERKA